MKNVKKAIALKKELDAFRPIKKDDELRIMQKFKLDWNFHSNNLEGNALSYGETKALLLFGITAQGKPLKDHFEITGHNEAVNWVMDIVKQERPLTENFIRELHELILKEPYEADAITPDGKPTKKKIKIGVYKTTPNHVKTRTGEIFRFATPEETPALMKDLLDWYRNKLEDTAVNPILLAAEFHYRYIRIHPFDDGNGRTARIVMNFILMQFGYPPTIIKTQDKQNYFSVLEQADAGILQPFIEYVAKNLVHSLELMLKGAKGQSIEEPDDLDKEIALLEQRLKTVGQTIEVTRSKDKDSILKIYDDTISKVTTKFIAKCELFEKIYVDLLFRFLVGKHIYKSKENAIVEGRKKISKSIRSIGISYHYETFKQIGFGNSVFQSQIIFQFYNTKYTISNSSGTAYFERSYGEQLTEEEINKLINSETKSHKVFIEARIKDSKK